MGEPSIFWKIRAWIAYHIVLKIFYFVFGSKPLFCDVAGECEFEGGYSSLLTRMKEERLAYNRVIWALVASSGGEIRINKVTLHDAQLPNSEVSTYEDSKTGDYVYSAKP